MPRFGPRDPRPLDPPRRPIVEVPLDPRRDPEPAGVPDTVPPGIVNPRDPGGDRLPNSD